MARSREATTSAEGILAKRRALLIMPALNDPAIEAALSSGGNDGVFVARVLLAAEPAVSLNLADDMRALLISVREGG